MQDLIAFFVVVAVAVGGAETVRAMCSRRLATPATVKVRAPQPAAEAVPVVVVAASSS